eukprot:gene27638-16676_t
MFPLQHGTANTTDASPLGRCAPFGSYAGHSSFVCSTAVTGCTERNELGCSAADGMTTQACFEQCSADAACVSVEFGDTDGN